MAVKSNKSRKRRKSSALHCSMQYSISFSVIILFILVNVVGHMVILWIKKRKRWDNVDNEMKHNWELQLSFVSYERALKFSGWTLSNCFILIHPFFKCSVSSVFLYLSPLLLFHLFNSFFLVLLNFESIMSDFPDNDFKGCSVRNSAPCPYINRNLCGQPGYSSV